MINMFLYQIPTFARHGKTKKTLIKTINLKYQLQRGTKKLIHLTDHIQYQIFKIILSIL